MAFALRVSGTTKNGEEVQIEPSWWNIKELRDTYDFKEELDYYLDCYLYINKQTFYEIIKSQEKYRRKESFQVDYWMEENQRNESELDDLIKSLEKDSTIKIWIYEWESGLG